MFTLGIPTRRIVALTLLTAIAIALGLLRFSSGSARPAVPTGAQAGDLTLSTCTYQTEDGGYLADCGILTVPENRADPASRLIALPVTRIRAVSPNPGEPVFRLEGGPGKSNMDFPYAHRLAGERDVVLVGYRGVDGSVRLDCPEVTAARKRTADLLSSEAFERSAKAFAACAARLQREGIDLAGYTIPQRVDDLEAARVALGYGRINLVSESAGTRYALVYAWRYPQSVNRSVLIAANPPGHFLYDAPATDELLARYAARCGESEPCRARTSDLLASLRAVAAEMPQPWLFLPIHPGNARAGSFFGLVHATSATAPLTGPMTVDTWLSAAEGDPSGLWLFSLLAGLVLPEGTVWGEHAAMGMQDAAAARSFFAGTVSRQGILGAPATDYLWAGGALVDAWPRNPDHELYGQMQRSDAETLVISGNLDFATPPQVAARELLPYLPNGQKVVLADLGHSTDFWTYQPQASGRLLATFFRDGTVDASQYTHHTLDFTPPVPHPMMARMVLGTMVAVAVAALLSLVWLVLRLRRRHALGVKVSTALRSLLPAVLGLGGWFAASLVVLVFLPALPINDPRLAVIATALPIGAGIALAWLNPAESGMYRMAGILAATGGALAGGWFGFYAAGGLVALLTTIAAAVAAANLALIALDALSGAGMDQEGGRQSMTGAADRKLPAAPRM